MDITARNVAICEALGLDPTKIRKGGVTITLDGKLGPIVEVQYRTMDESLISSFTGAVERYKLVPIEENEAPDVG